MSTIRKDLGDGRFVPIVALNVEAEGALPVGGTTARPSASFSRPADITAYASGDLVANSTTAASVTPMSFAVARATGKGGMIRGARLRKTGSSTTNASFRLHLFSSAPTIATTGDNGVFASVVSGAANYMGYIDITVDVAMADGAAGRGLNEINYITDTVFALLEARGAYTPGNAEQFTIQLEALQN